MPDAQPLPRASARVGALAPAPSLRPSPSPSASSVRTAVTALAARRPPPPAPAAAPPPDIEYYPVADDPRLWSPSRKWAIVAVLSCGSWIPSTSANILFPALPKIEASLHTTAGILAMSVSLFILFQGGGSITFVPISELYGRRWIYISCLAVFSAVQWVAGTAKSIGLFLAMRILGGYMSSPLLTMAGATIADLYAVEERATKISIYYSAPMLGPSIGSLLGGGLTSAGSWRYPFYFLGASGAAIFATFLVCYRETFRKERSLVWHKARKRSLEEALAQDRAHPDGRLIHHHEGDVSWFARLRLAHATKPRILRRALDHSKEPAPSLTAPLRSLHKNLPTVPERAARSLPSIHRVLLSGVESAVLTSALEENHELEDYERSYCPPYQTRQTSTAGIHATTPQSHAEKLHDSQVASRDAEAEAELDLARTQTVQSANIGLGQEIDRIVTGGGVEEVVKVKVRLADVNPLTPMVETLKQPHNVLSVLYSGFTFASQYSLSYTATRSFSNAPYNYSPVVIGLILFGLGAGGVIGSLVGGKMSDLRLRRLRLQREARCEEDGTPFVPVPSEERIKALFWFGLLVPLPFFGYAWLVDKGVHVAGPVVMLFLIGLLQFSCYSVFLAYLVDANKGRSSAAVSANSCFRGAVACVGSQISGPLQHSMGTGWMISGWGFVLILAQCLLMVVAAYGTQWRMNRLERLRRCAEAEQ